MKQSLITTLFIFCVISIGFAQTPAPLSQEPTIEDIEKYERYLDKLLEMDFRMSAIDAIQLTPEEINAFNPIFNRYIKEKDLLTDKKFHLLEEYTSDIQNEADANDKAEETSDFIEEFWEVEIAEMELKKDYFDILEDKIPYKKAIDFFLFEESVENNIIFDMLKPVIPALVKTEEWMEATRSPSTMDKTAWPAHESWKKASKKDKKRYFDNRLEMDVRLTAIEAMELTKEEIIAFNPVFDQYMDKNDGLVKKKLELIDDYVKDIKKMTDADNRAEETSDFVEDFWEIEIAEMILKKNYYDILENKIPYNKAIKFFLFEETLENRLKRDQVTTKLPAIAIIQRQRKERQAQKDISNRAMTSTATDRNKMERDTKQKTSSTNQKMDKSPTTKISKDSKEMTKDAGDKMDMQGDEADKKIKAMASKTRNQAEETADEMEMEETAEEVQSAANETRKEAQKMAIKTANKVAIDAQETANEMKAATNKAMMETDKMATKAANKVAIDAQETADEMKAATNKARMETDKAANKMTDKSNNSGTATSTMSNKTVKERIDASKANMKYDPSIVTFDSWVNTHKGQMGLDHDYVTNGLNAVSATIEATANRSNVVIENWSSKKAQILSLSEQLKMDPKSKMHADWTKEAFSILATSIKTLNEKSQYTYAHGQVSLLEHYANRLNVKKRLLNQAPTVYSFFETADNAVKEIWEDVVIRQALLSQAMN